MSTIDIRGSAWDSAISKLVWLHEPESHSVVDGKLLIRPVYHGRVYLTLQKAKSDFWQKTYYDPILISDSGHLFYMTAPFAKGYCETHFSYSPRVQFDQGGLAVGCHYYKPNYFRCVTTKTTGLSVASSLSTETCA
jgi:regulation of enolase protein 1 (concanavalin A-like superfamily)